MTWIKVYITKYALECGILEYEVNTVNEFGGVYVANSPYDNDRYAHEGEWFTDKQNAIDKAYQMKNEVIESLYKQIYKLEQMEFE